MEADDDEEEGGKAAMQRRMLCSEEENQRMGSNLEGQGGKWIHGRHVVDARNGMPSP